MKVEQSIIIACPVEEVFAYRSALHQATEWQPDLIANNFATLAATSVGARGTERRRGPNGVTEEWDLEITEFEPNCVLGIASRCGAVQVHERDVFAPDEGNTRYTAYVEMTGSKLPTSAFKKRTVDTLLHFKWRLEL